MGISRTVVQDLREFGHEAIHLSEEGQQRLSDASIITKARAEDRVILTHDLDFARLMAISEDSKPSAITFRLTDMRPRNVLTHLSPALDQFAVELHNGALVSVGDFASRCGRLPINRRD